MSAIFDLKERMNAMGIEPKKAFGQNFLVSTHVIDKILQQVKRLKFSEMVEIGPGLGALTEGLIEVVKKENAPAADSPEQAAAEHGAGFANIKLIELDRDLAAYWRSRELQVFEADALRLNWAELALPPNSILVSNLPYQISSSLVIDRCFGPIEIQHMILMFQKEVAQRLMSPHGCGEYGILSVMAQLHFKMEKVSDAAPRDFFPPPKVASRVLAFERLKDVDLGPRFLTFVKAAFAFRRKFLLKNLKSVVDKSRLDRLESAFSDCGLSLQSRAEELSPPKFVELFRKVYE